MKEPGEPAHKHFGAPYLVLRYRATGKCATERGPRTRSPRLCRERLEKPRPDIALLGSFLRLLLQAVSKCRWRRAPGPAEGPREVGRMVEVNAKSYFSDTKATGLEQRSRFSHAPVENVPRWRYSHALLESTQKVKRTETGSGSQLGERDRPAQMFLDIGLSCPDLPWSELRTFL